MWLIQPVQFTELSPIPLIYRIIWAGISLKLLCEMPLYPHGFHSIKPDR